MSYRSASPTGPAKLPPPTVEEQRLASIFLERWGNARVGLFAASTLLMLATGVAHATGAKWAPGALPALGFLLFALGYAHSRVEAESTIVVRYAMAQLDDDEEEESAT